MAALGKEVNLRAEGAMPAETSETWMKKSERWMTMPDGKYALEFICRILRTPKERFGPDTGVAPEGWVSSITFGTDGESSEVWFDCTFPNLEGGGGSRASVSHGELVRLLVEEDAETTAKREAKNAKSAMRRADTGGDKFLRTGAGEIALDFIGRRVSKKKGEAGKLVYGTVVVVTCKRNAVSRDNFKYTCIFDKGQSTEEFTWKELKKMLQSEDERETPNMPKAPNISTEKRKEVLSSAVEQAKLVVMKLPPPKKKRGPRRPRGVFSSCFYCIFSPCFGGSGKRRKKTKSAASPNYVYDYYYDPYYYWYYMNQEPATYHEGWTYLYPDYDPEDGGQVPTSYVEYEAGCDGGGDAGGWFGDWGAGDGGDDGGWGDGGDGGGWGDGGDGGGGGGDGGDGGGGGGD